MVLQSMAFVLLVPGTEGSGGNFRLQEMSQKMTARAFGVGSFRNVNNQMLGRSALKWLTEIGASSDDTPRLMQFSLWVLCDAGSDDMVRISLTDNTSWELTKDLYDFAWVFVKAPTLIKAVNVRSALKNESSRSPVAAMRVSQHFMVIAEKKAAMDAAKETASASATPSAKRRRPAGGSGARGGSSTKSRKSSGGASVSGGGGGGGRSSSSSDDDDDDKENDEDDDDGGEWTTQRLVALGSEIKIWDKLMDIYDGDAAVATADPALKKRGSSDDVPTKLRKSRQMLARLGSASEFEIARNAMPNPRYFWCGLCKKYFACSTLADPKDFRQHMTRAHHPELVSVLDGAVSFGDMDDPADYTRAKKQLSADECRSSYCLAPKPAGVPAKLRKQVAASVRAFVPP